MPTYRKERWGRIEYNSDTDEFEAYLASSAAAPKVDHPLSAGVLVTGRCNLRCEFCYGNYEALPEKEIDVYGWKTIFARLRSWGLMRVDLSGGEPTMRRDLPEIVHAAQSFGLATVVSTNGQVLNKTRLNDFPRTRWHVSLDSGFDEIHERSRLLPVLKPSSGSLEKAGRFITSCREQDLPVRVLTCVGSHNREALFSLAEKIALWGVSEWNISRVLRAGRAQQGYGERWEISNESLLEQVRDLQAAFHSLIHIRYSDRTEQQGYFLLVLPDGTLATQYTDGRDKVLLGDPKNMSLRDLQNCLEFDLQKHGEKWIAARLISPGRDDRSPVILSPETALSPEFGIL